MTDEELRAIGARAERAMCGAVERQEWAKDAMREAVALVAEVRRLRGLIKQVEHPVEDGGICPWCRRWGEHRRSCPAFTEGGRVR